MDNLHIKEDKSKLQTYDTGAKREIDASKGAPHLIPHFEWGYLSGPLIEHFEKDFYVKARYMDTLELCLYYFKKTREAKYLKFFIQYVLNEYIEMSLGEATFNIGIQYLEGASKYSAYNWKKGIPVTRFEDSLIRHYNQWRGWFEQSRQIDERYRQHRNELFNKLQNGYVPFDTNYHVHDKRDRKLLSDYNRSLDDENHVAAMIFNLIGLMWTIKHRPELDKMGNFDDLEQDKKLYGKIYYPWDK